MTPGEVDCYILILNTGQRISKFFPDKYNDQDDFDSSVDFSIRFLIG
jgi:hypothetical protein